MTLFIIDTMEKVKEKYDLITDLLDIQRNLEIQKECRENKANKKGGLAINPVDAHYTQLKCDVTELKPDNLTYQLIEKYV